MIAKSPLSIPGKTILLGEYAALACGAGLVVAHEPSYLFEFSKRKEEGFLPVQELFHVSSPAGHLVKKHPHVFEKLWGRFRSPYSQGGFGTSSAEFIAVWKVIFDLDQEGWSRLLEDYWSCVDSPSGVRPSGIDVLAQSQGVGLYEIARDQSGLQKREWPFSHLELCFLPTGVKVPTHEHLATLKSKKFEDLQCLLQKGCDSLKNKNENEFLQTVKDYSSVLSEYGFVAPTTLKMLSEVMKLPGVKAAKGCGALGADVILAVVETKAMLSFQTEFQGRWGRNPFFFPRGISHVL